MTQNLLISLWDKCDSSWSLNKLSQAPNLSSFSYWHTLRRNFMWVGLTWIEQNRKIKKEPSMTQSPIFCSSNLHHPIITQALETKCMMVRHEPRGNPYVEQTSLKVSSVTPADHTKPEYALRWRWNKKPWIRLSLSNCVTSIQISVFALCCVSTVINWMESIFLNSQMKKLLNVSETLLYCIMQSEYQLGHPVKTLSVNSTKYCTAE